MALKLITGPTGTPVTLAEAKAQVSQDLSDDDTLLTAFIATASEFAEQVTGRALLPQTWEVTLDEFPVTLIGYPDAILLTRVPATAVTSVSYTDLAGVTQTLASSAYAFRNDDDFGYATVSCVGTSWPDSLGNVKVRYTAGYANAAAVPASIKTWILLQVGALYVNREAEQVARGTLVQLGHVDRMLDRWRMYP